MALAKPPEDIRLDHGEPLAGPVLQVLFDLLVIKPLKYQPGGIAEVEEGRSGVVCEIAPVGTNANRAHVVSSSRHPKTGCMLLLPAKDMPIPVSSARKL